MSTTETPAHSLAGWRDPVLIRRRGRSFGHLFATAATIVLLAVLEASVLAPLMQIVLGMAPVEAWGVSAVIAIASAIAMHFAGRIHAGVGRHRSGDGRGRVVGLTAGWGALGIALAVLRVIGMATSTDVTGIGQGVASGPTAKDYVAAGLFLVLYVISGTIAFSQGMDRNDAHEAQVLAEQEHRRTRSQLEFWEAQLVRVSREMDRRQADVLRVDDLAAVERRLSERVRDASLGQVRTELGRLKGDPAVIGVASPRHPDHPVGRFGGTVEAEGAAE